MAAKKSLNAGSIFSQDLDRAIFVMYFLGAIMPLAALGITMHEFVFPALVDDANLTNTMLGLLIGISALTLIAFFALRRIASGAIRRMNADNARLQGILSASKNLSTSFHVQDVAEIAAECARSLTESKATLILMRAAADKPLALVASSGNTAQELFQVHADLIHELVEACLVNGSATDLASNSRPTVRAGESASSLESGLAFPLLAGDGSVGAVVVLNGPTLDGGLPAAEKDALSMLSTLTSVALKNVNLQDAQRNFFAHITELLVAAMDTHVDDRKGHATAVAELSNHLARELALPDAKMQRLHFAALLHDIGMLRIANAHQRTPGHFQKHPQLANRMLSRIRLWEDVAPIVLYHHEWYDGSGYPESIAGEAIPLESRIIAVADTYDALLRPSDSRTAMTVEQAVREIRNQASTQFDPLVVAALERLAAQGLL